ncbi:MAG: exo-alpha-sialidase [Phycisphaerales bacterium]|nr:exo-alpha-sialidase [Phycisphaerales bacterium]
MIRMEQNRAAAATLLVALTGALCASGAIGQQGVQINIDGQGFNIPNDAANEPSFSIDPLHPQHMVVGWREFPTVNSNSRYAGYAVTTDGGLTWYNGGTLPPPDGSPNGEQSDPVIAVDNDGRFFYNSLLFTGGQLGILIYNSDTGGYSWNDPLYLFTGFADKNWYTIDRSGASRHHYCSWGNTTIYVSRSITEGATWQTPQPLGAGIRSYMETGLNGELYLAWWDYNAQRVAFRTSRNASDPNQTPTWSPEVRLPFGRMPSGLRINPGGGSGQVWIMVDTSDGPSRGNVYACSSSVPANDVCDVMFARSTDGGQTFSTPIRINDDPPGQDYQWMASISIAPSGRLDATWFDTRDDPNHFISRLYYSYSWDGGLTWSPNRAVGDPFDPSLGYPQQNKIGDYFQCQSDNGSVSVIHPATFNGEQDIYYQRLHPMVLESSPLRAGEQAQFAVSEARPGEQAWVVYSLTGRGYTNIGMLDVPVNLARPQLGAGPRLADQSGNVMWTVTMPPQSQGRTVWFQAIQRENASNVIEAVVE